MCGQWGKAVAAIKSVKADVAPLNRFYVQVCGRFSGLPGIDGSGYEANVVDYDTSNSLIANAAECAWV